MTIPTNYSELQTAIEEDLSRSDLTAELPNFINKGEAVINRRLRNLAMETKLTTLSLTAATAEIALPAGYLENFGLRYNDNNVKPTQLGIEKFEEHLGYPGVAVPYPRHFYIGDKIYFDRNATATVAMTMRYLKKWDIAADTTNALLTSDPDIYLYAGLVASLTKTGPHERGTVWAQAFDAAIRDMNTVAHRSRKNARLAADPALQRTNVGTGYNINEG